MSIKRHNLHTQISCCYRGFFYGNLNKIDKYIILWHLVASLMILWYENVKIVSSKKQKNATFFANWFFLTWYSFNSTLVWCYFFISTFLSFSSGHYILCWSISMVSAKGNSLISSKNLLTAKRISALGRILCVGCRLFPVHFKKIVSKINQMKF